MKPYTASDRKIKYGKFFSERGDVPVFLAPWWLDLDAGPDNWDVALAETNGQLIGALPYCFTQLRFFKGVGMPPVAPYQGYYIAYPPDQHKVASKIAWEQKVVRALFEGLPRLAFFYQHFPPETTNWTPLHWLGYRQTTKYSYVIGTLQNTQVLNDELESSTRRILRIAEKKLSVTHETDSRSLLELVALTYKKQNLPPPYDMPRLARLTEAAVSRQVGKIYIARDGEGTAHAGAFAVWDRGRAFFTIQAAHPAYLAHGGAALVAWHAIQDAASAGLSSFDFTGSMMPTVERFIRSFGAVPVQRHYISKENNPLLYWLMRVREYGQERGIEGRGVV